VTKVVGGAPGGEPARLAQGVEVEEVPVHAVAVIRRWR
jgi:hypothetical protein